MPPVLPSPLSLEFIAQNLRVIQADQRSIRSEMRVLSERIDGLERSLSERSSALERSLGDRIAGFEARMETRFNQIQAELGQNMQTLIDALSGSSPK